MSENFYRAFEDRHRGSREMIQSRLRVYLPFIAPLTKLLSPARAIDLGCGRGEWIELLGENGIDAFGVDLDEGMLAACRERGLNARKDDALGSLRALPDSSVALVSAFHVVEHIPFDDVQAVVREALRVLQPGGLLIFETPNPENIVVGTSGFYMDPSHEKPIPPNLLSFAVEYAGFQRTKVIRLQEPASLHTMPRIGVLEVLSAVSPDYSVIAQKNADSSILSEFDAPFDTEFGVSLAALANKYDAQTQQQFSEIRQPLDHFEDLLGDRAAQISRRFDELEDLATRSMQQAQLAQHHAAQLAGQMQALLASRSWRITAPMRAVGEAARRLRNAKREGRLITAIKRRVPGSDIGYHYAKRVLWRLVREIDRRPPLREFVLRHEAHLPGLAARLKSLHHPPPPIVESQSNSKQLSAAARRVLNDFDRSKDRQH